MRASLRSSPPRPWPPARRWAWLGRVVCHECSRPFEVVVALVTLATGAWYAWPVMTFTSTVAWRAFVAWVPETWAGVVMVGLGWLVIWGPRRGRTPALVLTIGGWAFSAALFALGNPAGTGWLWSLSFMALGLCSYLGRRPWGGAR